MRSLSSGNRAKFKFHFYFYFLYTLNSVSATHRFDDLFDQCEIKYKRTEIKAYKTNFVSSQINPTTNIKLEMKTMIAYIENRLILFFNRKKNVCQHSNEC